MLTRVLLEILRIIGPAQGKHQRRRINRWRAGRNAYGLCLGFTLAKGPKARLATNGGLFRNTAGCSKLSKRGESNIKTAYQKQQIRRQKGDLDQEED